MVVPILFFTILKHKIQKNQQTERRCTLPICTCVKTGLTMPTSRKLKLLRPLSKAENQVAYRYALNIQRGGFL